MLKRLSVIKHCSKAGVMHLEYCRSVNDFSITFCSWEAIKLYELILEASQTECYDFTMEITIVGI